MESYKTGAMFFTMALMKNMLVVVCLARRFVSERRKASLRLLLQRWNVRRLSKERTRNHGTVLAQYFGV